MKTLIAFVAVMSFASGFLAADFNREIPQDHHAHIMAHFTGLCETAMPEGYAGYPVFKNESFSGCIKVSTLKWDMSRPQFIKIVER